MASDIDVHIGRRLRRRRRLLGLTQLKLGQAIGMRFQQVQKYECGANRVTAERLYRLAAALRVAPTYFFEGLPDPGAANTEDAADERELIANDVLARKETMDLIRAYYMLDEKPRRRLLDLAKVLRTETTAAA